MSAAQQTSATWDQELRDALQDLREAPEEAKEEGFPAPSQVAIANAERLLQAIYRLLPHRAEVYPTPDGEIAIHAKIQRGSSVLMLCDAQGGASCLVNMGGKHSKKRYESSDDAPDSFLESALGKLAALRQ